MTATKKPSFATAVKKSTINGKSVASSKQRISKFGQMMGSCPDIKEYGNVWDL